MKVSSPRLYIFDCCVIHTTNGDAYSLKKEEMASTEMSIPCILVAHPKGTLMWDNGDIPDRAFPSGGGRATLGVVTQDTPLLPQLAAVGYVPTDITYLSMSHYHGDHIANASLVGVVPTLAYYAGTAASGTPLSGAPVLPGTYTVAAAFAGSPDYTAASATATFVIQPPKVTISGSVASTGTQSAGRAEAASSRQSRSRPGTNSALHIGRCKITQCSGLARGSAIAASSSGL